MQYSREQIEEAMLEAANEGAIEEVEEYEKLLSSMDTAQPSQEQGFLDTAKDFLSKNMEIPLGLGGSAAGAGIGFALGGPPGAVVGTIIGGATGSGAGSVTSDYLEGVPVDYAEATEQALISAGIDIVTLGLGSKVKPFLGCKRPKKRMIISSLKENFERNQPLDGR